MYQRHAKQPSTTVPAPHVMQQTPLHHLSIFTRSPSLPLRACPLGSGVHVMAGFVLFSEQSSGNAYGVAWSSYHALLHPLTRTPLLCVVTGLSYDLPHHTCSMCYQGEGRISPATPRNQNHDQPIRGQPQEADKPNVLHGESSKPNVSLPRRHSGVHALPELLRRSSKSAGQPPIHRQHRHRHRRVASIFFSVGYMHSLMCRQVPWATPWI